jgi:succinoglycan biosynthesis protein ExoV
MKLMYHHAQPGNFGDDLNAWLWRELLPTHVFDDNSAELFYGIGTVLSKTMPKSPRKIIFGSGTGYKTPPVIDGSFEVFFVRGPLTARALGIAQDLAITDPSYLILNTVYGAQPVVPRHAVSVIPHYLSLAMLDWETVAHQTGLRLINPTKPALNVVTQIRESRLVLTESLHGAILADAFRIPWIPIVFSHRFLEFKWRDWCQSVGLEFSPVRLPPVFQGSLTPQKRAANFVKNRLAQAGLGPDRWQNRPYRQSSAGELNALTSVLRQTAAGNGHLSADREFGRVLIQMTSQLERLKTRQARDTL